MAYSDDIDALNPYYAFDFDGNATERINGMTTGASSIDYNGDALCEGVSNSMLTNGISDLLSLSTLEVLS